MNIDDAETERLAAEVAELTAETKTAAIRESLRERRERLISQESPEQRQARLRRFLEGEIWPQIPPDLRGQKITKERREEILGYGPGGV